MIIQIKTPEEFDKLVKDCQKAGVRHGITENQNAVKALLSPENSLNARNLAKALAGADFRAEMRLWQTDDKGMLKGSADGVFLKDNMIFIAEFKTIFGKDPSAQVTTGKAQVKKYSELISKLAPAGKKVAGEAENWDGVITIKLK